MPTTKQIDSNRATSNLNPILGGGYRDGELTYEEIGGYWAGSEVSIYVVTRYGLNFNGTNLSTGQRTTRRYGTYIRCVSEEKTVLDLTYMEEMICRKFVGFFIYYSQIL